MLVMTTHRLTTVGVNGPTSCQFCRRCDLVIKISVPWEPCNLQCLQIEDLENVRMSLDPTLCISVNVWWLTKSVYKIVSSPAGLIWRVHYFQYNTCNTESDLHWV